MAKKTNTTIKTSPQPIKRSYMEAREAFNYRMQSNNSGLEERIADDFLEWASENTQTGRKTDMHEFFLLYGMPYTTWRSIYERNEYAKEANDAIRLMFGVRDKKLALDTDNKIDTGTIHRTLKLYHPDWKSVDDQDHDRKKELKLLEAKEPERPTFVFVEREVKETEIVRKAIEDGNRKPE